MYWFCRSQREDRSEILCYPAECGIPPLWVALYLTTRFLMQVEQRRVADPRFERRTHATAGR